MDVFYHKDMYLYSMTRWTRALAGKKTSQRDTIEEELDFYVKLTDKNKKKIEGVAPLCNDSCIKRISKLTHSANSSEIELVHYLQQNTLCSLPAALSRVFRSITNVSNIIKKKTL